MRLNEGLVFLSDSRTNAGVDQVGTFRKMSVFENPGDRMLVLMTAGNLSISQAIRQLVSEHVDADGRSIWNVGNMYEAARIVGEAVRTVHQREAKALAAAKHTVGRIGTLVAEECIQLHGGIGMTWELPFAHYAKRLVMIDHQFGDEDHHLARYIELNRAH